MYLGAVIIEFSYAYLTLKSLFKFLPYMELSFD